MKNEKQSFFDQKTLIAIVLTTLVWIGWQMHLQKKYPPQNTPTPTATAQNSANTTTTSTAVETPAVTKSTQQKNDEIAEAVAPEKTYDVDTDFWSFKISSRGMGLKDFVLKKYKDRQGQPVQSAPILPVICPSKQN